MSSVTFAHPNPVVAITPLGRDRSADYRPTRCGNAPSPPPAKHVRARLDGASRLIGPIARRIVIEESATLCNSI